MLTLINSFQVFDQVYVMTSGGPGTATLTLVQYIYTTAFRDLRMGYGAAVATLLFAIWSHSRSSGLPIPARNQGVA